MYTAQKNRFGNIIVCRGDAVRNSYDIVFIGTYEECLRYITKIINSLEK